MSKLKKLIEELCPEGVEYKPLGEIGTFERGRRFVKADAVDKDGIPCVHYGELYTHYGLWANEHKSQIRSDIQTKLRFAEKNDIIIVGAGENNIDIGIAVAWLGDYKVAVHDACYIFKHQQDPKYISYLLRTNSYHQQIKKFVSEGKICSISAESLAKAVLPFPPVPVQQEIVRILDKYIMLETELEAELKAESETRKRQYEHYRNQLFTFASNKSENVKWMSLGDIGMLIKGSGIQKSDFVENGYPCIHYGQLHTYFGTFADKNKSFINKELYNKCKKANYGDILIATTSEDVDACCKATAWLGGEIAISGDAHVLRHNQDPKYIAYFFQTEDFAKQKRKYAIGVKVVRVNSDNLAKIVIPIPPIEEQQRIVSNLERFETLITDLLLGLPAEITARRQQYEYYREKLLTFKRKVA